MPPAGVNMDLIREALARRMQGAGGVAPAVQQTSQPNASLPTGGPNVPSGAPAPMPNAQPNQLPVQGSPAPAASATPMQKVAGVAQTAQGMPDEDTRKIAKALLGKLVQFL